MEQKLHVVTGWSPSGWIEYGRRFWETFDRYWPAEVDLIVYGEEPVELKSACGRHTEFRRLNEIRAAVQFLEKHGDSGIARGREPVTHWKPREVANGYSYKWDAVKFCRQGFIPYHAAGRILFENKYSEALLMWLDGDVYTHAPVPLAAVLALLPRKFDLAYLGREPKHSEIGFQLYRLPGAMHMLGTFSDYYATDRVFAEKQWHSAYVFDLARHHSQVRAFNITPGGTGHVWMTSPLATFSDHLKGGRKGHEKSPERRRV